MTDYPSVVRCNFFPRNSRPTYRECIYLFLPIIKNYTRKLFNAYRHIDVTSLCGVLVIVHSKKSDVLVIPISTEDGSNQKVLVLTLIKNACFYRYYMYWYSLYGNRTKSLGLNITHTDKIYLWNPMRPRKNIIYYTILLTQF